MSADERLSKDFYEWLDKCPVQWAREEVTEETVSYCFYPGK